jgi:23S rRNA (uracil747-C5)-methyltransferase
MKCEYFKNNKCNSCNLLDSSYMESLLLKEHELKQLFPIHLSSIKPTIAISDEVSKSRNKAKFAVFPQNEKITFGFYHRDGAPRELEFCPLHAEGINALLPSIRDILEQHKIKPYDINSKSGELKYLLITSSQQHNNDEFLLRFVMRSKDCLVRLKRAAAEICSVFPAIKVITANIQPIHQAIIEGNEEIVLTNDSVIIHQFDEFQLAMGAKSFFQVTPEIAKLLYNAVANSVAEDTPASLIDLYCGVGVFSFYATRYCPDITGVEISKEAIDCANYSANLNHIKANFIAMDVELYLKNNQKKFEAVLINPPRRGLNAAIISMIKDVAPKFIYYSSCNAQTMARDFSAMQDIYEIKSLQIFDMFPFTSHYETLMCLIRRDLTG